MGVRTPRIHFFSLPSSSSSEYVSGEDGYSSSVEYSLWASSSVNSKGLSFSRGGASGGMEGRSPFNWMEETARRLLRKVAEGEEEEEDDEGRVMGEERGRWRERREGEERDI